MALLVLSAVTILVTALQIENFSHESSKGQADAAIVLGAAIWTNKPSPVFQERIDRAVSLYRAGRVRKIIFTGGLSDGDSIAESLAARRSAVAQGVPARDILVEDRSKSTYENLIYAKEVASKAGLKSFLIVSNPLHLWRAKVMAWDLGMDAECVPAATRPVPRRSHLAFLWRETYHLLEYRIYDRWFGR